MGTACKKCVWVKNIQSVMQKKKKKPARKNVSVCGVGRQTEKQRGRLMC